MASRHPAFWLDLAGKLGPPIVAASLVACLLEGKFEPMHTIVFGVGVLLIGVSHWFTFHRGIKD